MLLLRDLFSYIYICFDPFKNKNKKSKVKFTWESWSYSLHVFLFRRFGSLQWHLTYYWWSYSSVDCGCQEQLTESYTSWLHNGADSSRPRWLNIRYVKSGFQDLWLLMFNWILMFESFTIGAVDGSILVSVVDPKASCSYLFLKMGLMHSIINNYGPCVESRSADVHIFTWSISIIMFMQW